MSNTTADESSSTPDIELPTQTPLKVTIFAVVGVLDGLYRTVIGIGVLDESLLLGVPVIAFGLAYTYSMYSLRKMEAWAHTVAFVLVALGCVFSLLLLSPLALLVNFVYLVILWRFAGYYTDE